MIVGFAISVLAIYLLLQSVSVKDLAGVFGRGVQPLMLGFLVLMILLSLATRALRWQVYFLPALRVPFNPLVGTLAISYMASTILPLRAGELVRAVFLGQRAQVSVPLVIGTILLEKLFDFLAIAVLLLLLVSLAPLPAPAVVAGTSTGVFILCGFAFVVALAIWREPSLRVLAVVNSLLPFRLGERLRLDSVARQFAEGTDSLRVARLWIPMLGWTAVTWVLSLVATWAGCLALGVQPGLPAVLSVVIITSSSQAVPSSPGHVGVYHLAASKALESFGVDAPTALAIAIVTHAFSYGSLVVAGLVALWTGGYSFSEVLASVKGVRASTAATSAIAPDAWRVAPDP